MIQNYVELHLLFLQDGYLAAPVMAVGVAVCQKMATYPLDTVNRRMMMTSGEVVKYQSSIHAFAEIIRNEGAKSLYKGGGACILETITLAAILTVFSRRMWNYLSTKKSNSAADGVSAKRNGLAGGVNLHQLSSLNGHMVRMTWGNSGGGPRRYFTSEGNNDLGFLCNYSSVDSLRKVFCNPIL